MFNKAKRNILHTHSDSVTFVIIADRIFVFVKLRKFLIWWDDYVFNARNTEANDKIYMYIFCCNWVIVWGRCVQDIGQLLRFLVRLTVMLVCGFIVVIIIQLLFTVLMLFNPTLIFHKQDSLYLLQNWFNRPKIVQNIVAKRVCVCANHYSNNVLYNVLSKSIWMDVQFGFPSTPSLISRNVPHSIWTIML